MRNKILITIQDLKDITKLKELGINNYVFPLKDFCVGIPNTFLISKIPKEELSNSYIFLNRVLDNEGIDKFKDILKSLPNIKGIIFDDLGILEILKDYNYEKILYLSHFNTNKLSTKLYLEYVSSVIISTDITKGEIEEILQTNPSISLFTFGLVPSMYSRRLLIDNYCKFHKLKKENPLVITNSGISFLVYENEYGTCFYYNKIFNGYSLFDLNAKYYFINMTFLNLDILERFLNNEKIDNSDEGFLNKETIYKLKEGA